MAFIGNLRVLTDPAGTRGNPNSISPEYVDLDPNDLEFKVLKLSIHLALRMLESSRGRVVLGDIGVNTVNTLRGSSTTVRYTADVNHIPSYLTYFLRTVRSDFFTTYLTNNIRTGGGVAQCQLGIPSTGLRNYKPKLDGCIKVSKMVCSRLLLLSRPNLIQDSLCLLMPWGKTHRSSKT